MSEPTEPAAPTTVDELFSVSGKTVVITGGSRGIGRMIAGGFVSGGADVVIASRKAEAVAASTAELAKFGSCRGLVADLSTEQGARALADAVAADHDKVHVLINNAGATWGAPLADHDSASWDRVLNLNVQGVFHTTKFFLPLLQAAATHDDPSRVINIGSIDGIHVPVLESYSYSSSKAAVHQLTRHLARQLAPSITVNAVAPGPFESKMMAATLDAFGEQIASSAPLKRIGRPDDMAGVAIFLASRAGAYLTGAIIPVDGGIATVG
jgi:NAD(P)-dependent dehydrogenase (short-subunit alcohol dehydrogenase family)